MTLAPTTEDRSLLDCGGRPPVSRAAGPAPWKASGFAVADCRELWRKASRGPEAPPAYRGGGPQARRRLRPWTWSRLLHAVSRLRRAASWCLTGFGQHRDRGGRREIRAPSTTFPKPADADDILAALLAPALGHKPKPPEQSRCRPIARWEHIQRGYADPPGHWAVSGDRGGRLHHAPAYAAAHSGRSEARGRK